ncbi:MAG TPA: hypothetical protein VF494_13730 [Candidatus Limnocylindrales bacterium]
MTSANGGAAERFLRWQRTDDGREFRLATAAVVMVLLGIGIAGSGLQLILAGDTDVADPWSDTLLVVGAALLVGGVAAFRHRYFPLILVTLAGALGLGLYSVSQDAGNWTLLVGALALAALVVSSRSAFAK